MPTRPSCSMGELMMCSRRSSRRNTAHYHPGNRSFKQRGTGTLSATALCHESRGHIGRIRPLNWAALRVLAACLHHKKAHRRRIGGGPEKAVGGYVSSRRLERCLLLSSLVLATDHPVARPAPRC